MHASSDRAWEDMAPSEINKFINLVIYMGIVKVPLLKLYWNSETSTVVSFHHESRRNVIL